MKPVKTHRFRGHRWWIENDQALPDGQFGECIYGLSGITYATLRVPIEGDGQHDLDTLIHEALHACMSDAGEDAVTETASDITRFLWRLGWRKDPDA